MVDETNNGSGDVLTQGTRTPLTTEPPEQKEELQAQPSPPAKSKRTFSSRSMDFFRRNSAGANQNTTNTRDPNTLHEGDEEDDDTDEEDDSIASLNENNYMEEVFGTQHVAKAMSHRTHDEEMGPSHTLSRRQSKPIPSRKATQTTLPEPIPPEQDSSDTSQEGYDEDKPPIPPPPTPPPATETQPQVQPQLTRRSSMASVVEKVKKYRWWDDEFKHERAKIITEFLINYFFLVVGFAGVLCIYSGSYFQRDLRFKNLKTAVIIADQNVGDLPNIVGQTVEYYFTNVPSVQTAGDFEIWNYTMISELAKSKNHTLRQEIEQQIHHQRYWATYYVHENATLDWYQALVTQSQEFTPVEGLMEVIFETGRDYMAVSNYIITLANELLRDFNSFAPQAGLVDKMLQTLNDTQAFDVLENAPHLISTIPTFVVNDLHPVPTPLFQGTVTLASVYIIIMTFFSQVFCLEINMFLAKKVTGALFVIFKILTTQISYLFISLGFIVLNTAFQLPFNVTFGHSGFLVIWMFAFLLMSALGSIIEVLVMICFATKPPLLGFVLVYTVVVNLSPTISPIALCPPFYRYGYAVPLKNFYDLLQVAYFNAWKKHMGRNIGVMVAWSIVSNAILPFTMKWVAHKKEKDEAKKKLQKEREKLEKQK